MSQTTVHNTLFTPEVAEEIRAVIKQYHGSEVFLMGTCQPDGLVISVEAMAFGNKNSVPAPAQNAKPGQVMIHNHPSGVLEPSGADVNVASVYGAAGIGFYIINNQCSEVRVVVKPFFPKQDVPLDFQELEDLFGAGGHLQKTFPGFEHRPQQLAMMKTVTTAFNDHHIAVIEAGTGVGKSFAYLAPAILWSLANKKRVVVSTNTINLQEQLLQKDLPELARQMGREVKAVLVKGRGNYISLRRLRYSQGRADLFAEDRNGEVASITEWAEKTQDGSRSEFPHQISDDVWEAVMSDKDDCLRAACPDFNRCLFYKSRREATSADIIIANHHLVMADVALRIQAPDAEVGILPPFDHIIFDEAHNLEDVATKYFTTDTSQAGIRRQLARIARRRDQTGNLQALTKALRGGRHCSRSSVTAELLSLIMEQILPTRAEVENAIAMYFDDFFAESLTFFHADNIKENDRREFRITPAVTQSDYWTVVNSLLDGVATALHRLVELFDRLDSLFARMSEEALLEIMEPRLRLSGAVRKLRDHDAAIRFFLSADDNSFCRWVELGFRRGKPFIYPRTAPLDVSSNLRSALFSRKKMVVLTSATLSIDNNFAYFTRQVGLSQGRTVPTGNPGEPTGDPDHPDAITARTRFLQLDTPFDYHANCLFALPQDLPAPADPSFHRTIAPLIIEAVRVTNGRAMVLFTSYYALKAVAELCRGPLMASGIQTLQQGQVPRHQLVELFRAADKAALFATSSFWEGVDVQGDALQCLIITKLPFSVPSTPLFEARAEALERAGGNSFYEIAVPQAVIKFKQGFGRLIRSHTDRGFVLMLDNRVMVQRYGQIFLRSLPPARRVVGAGQGIIPQIRAFMAESFL